MRSPIQTPSIVNHRAHCNNSRRQTRTCLRRSNSPLHLRPCPLLTHQSAGVKPPRLLPSRLLLPSVRPRSHLSPQLRRGGLSARRGLSLPPTLSLLVPK